MLLLPDELEAVLSSLVAQKVIKGFKVGQKLTVVTLPKGRTLTLLDMLEDG